MGGQSVQRRRLMTLCRELGLRDDERMELAEILLKRDIASYTQLTEPEVARLVDALVGYDYVSTLMSMRV